MLIDTHCHLDDDRYDEDFLEVLDRANKNSVDKFIIPSADPSTLQKAFDLSQKYPNIYYAVGVHPYDIENYDKEYLNKFIDNKKCVAIGECGLDYFRLPKDEAEKKLEIKKQKDIFIQQILWAKELKKPLIVHIREASNDSFELLNRYAGDEGGVLHCYNADEVLLKLADKNFYFGIGGVLTFKNAKKLINVYPKIPQDKLLVETDSPYLTPHPHRGERNEPSYTHLVAQKMSQLSNLSIEQISNTTTTNAKNLFNI